jgi:hypothetical protein
LISSDRRFVIETLDDAGSSNKILKATIGS